MDLKAQALTVGRRLWNDFRAFSPGQKAVTIAAALALVIGGVVFATWRSAPSYAPLYTNLAATDASAIVDKLSSEKIPYQLAADGTEILVPKDKVYSTRLTMSSAGLPNSGQSGYSLLDKEGVTTSQFKQQIDYQRAIEGELDRTIEAINGVQAASVHLAIPQQNVFNDGSQKPTAAVLLTTKAGDTLTSSQVQSVVYLVSSSVPNMAADSVTVSDANGHVLAAPGDGVLGASGMDAKAQATQNYDSQLSTSIENMINQVVGAGHSVVTVNSDLDFAKTSTTTKNYTYDPSAPPLSKQENKETYTGNQAGRGGTLGAGTPAATQAAGAGNGKYTKSSSTVDNALGTVTKTTQNAPGELTKLSIAVLIDSSAAKVNLPAIHSLVSSAVGLNPARGDTLAIKAMPFNQSAANAAAKSSAAAAKAASASAAHQHLMSLVRQGALGAIILAVIVATLLAARRRRTGRAGAGDGPDDYPDDDLFGPELLDLPPAPPEPELPAVDASVREANARRQALATLADEQPDDVARVLSDWLNTREGAGK